MKSKIKAKRRSRRIIMADELLIFCQQNDIHLPNESFVRMILVNNVLRGCNSAEQICKKINEFVAANS